MAKTIGIDFQHLHSDEENSDDELEREEVVRVDHTRARGRDPLDNVFVLIKRRLPRSFSVQLFPSSCRLDAMAFGWRLLDEGLAEVVIGGGQTRTRDCRCEINIEFINPAYSEAEAAHVLAVGLARKGYEDFIQAPITFQNKPFLGLVSVADLILKYSELSPGD